MKKIFLLALILMQGVYSSAQYNALSGIIPDYNFYSRELGFYVGPKYDRTVNKEMLNQATVVNELVDGYPSNWISEYVSVSIKATCNGKLLEATNTNEKLSKEQKNILKSADLGSEIIVKVIYKYDDWEASNNSTINLNNNVQSISFKMTITPETEVAASFVGGEELLNTYLMENAIHKISGATARKIKTSQVTFTVNESGKIENAQLSKTSNDAATDKLLVDVITNMPNWNPAKNSKGKAVKQEFKFSVLNYGC